MSKNTTRKSVAVISAVALGFAALSAPAAYAVGTVDGKVTLAASAGATYTMLANEKFDLVSNFSTAADNGTNLKFYVTDANSISKFDVTNSDSLLTSDTPAGPKSEINTTNGSGSPAAPSAADVVITNSGSDSLITLLLTSAGIEVGDAVVVSGSTYKKLTGDTAVNFDGTHEVTAIAGTTAITFKVLGKTLTALDASTAANLIEFDLVEGTEQDALDSADKLRAATFGAVGATGAIAEKTTAAAGRNDDGSYIVDSADNDDAGVDTTLRLAATAAGSVTVQSWIDSDDDNVIDSNEYASPERTVTFVAASDVTVTTTLDATLVGAVGVRTLQAYVNISNDVNLAQFATGDFKVDFKADASSVAADIGTTYDTTTKLLKSGNHSSYTITAGTTYSAQAEYALANIGAVAYVSSETGSSNIGGLNNNDQGVLAPVVATDTTWNGTNVKSGTTTVQAKSAVTTYVTSGTAPAAPAGVVARVTITKSVLDSTTTITAGGKTLTSTGTSITYQTVTDALGKVVVDLTSSTGKKNDSVVVKVEVLDSNSVAGTATNGTSGYNANASDLTLTWADATVAASTAVVNLDAVGTSATLNVAKGATKSISYMVRDSFGGPLTAAGYRLAVTSGSPTGGGSVTTTAAVSGGYATVTFTDNTVSTSGNYTVAVDLEKLNVGGTSYSTVAAGADVSTVVYVHSTAVTAVTTTTAMLSSAGKLGLESGVDVVNVDHRGVGLTFPYTGATFQVTGKAKASTGGGVAGLPVTITADSALVGFTTATSGSNLYYSTGSITVMTQANGDYVVESYSNKAGLVNFTVTVGGVSTTTAAYFAAAAQNAGTVLTVNAPATAGSGTTLSISGSLADKYGNAVSTDGTGEGFKLTYTGPGYFGTAPANVSTDGTFAFNVLLGTNDSGTATVVVGYDQNDATATADYVDAKDILVTKTILIGAAAVASDTKVNVGTFKGFVALYAKGYEGQKMSAIVAGKWIVVESLASDFERVVRFTGAGYTITTKIYIDGVQVGDAFTTVTK
jgi:hypothetical protein